MVRCDSENEYIKDICLKQMCSKYVNHSRFINQHIWKPISTFNEHKNVILIMNKNFI